eukprot:CAMPEP_0118949692 /NCGR_PEP_ID=MMETSP1169-20130426/50107_1 /TAXON_ID=36882 /ORGANISM="Pyramimonas obovata, Strain CCMP722" /LENGTH=130 /DNA_ID=CAMNT_0006896385 /DNA_START=1 /DNA_END=393 /DNA_ORIENTATION=+
MAGTAAALASAQVVAVWAVLWGPGGAAALGSVAGLAAFTVAFPRLLRQFPASAAECPLKYLLAAALAALTAYCQLAPAAGAAAAAAVAAVGPQSILAVSALLGTSYATGALVMAAKLDAPPRPRAFPLRL